MRPQLYELLARVDRCSVQADQLSEHFGELRDQIRQAISISQLDPEMSLARSRKVLEYIVRDIYDETMRPKRAGTQPLEGLIQNLVKEGHFPNRLAAYADMVRGLGNVGVHTFDKGVSSNDVLNSLGSLMPIVEWFFQNRKRAGGLDQSTSASQSRPQAAPLPPPLPVQKPPAAVSRATGDAIAKSPGSPRSKPAAQPQATTSAAAKSPGGAMPVQNGGSQSRVPAAQRAPTVTVSLAGPPTHSVELPRATGRFRPMRWLAAALFCAMAGAGAWYYFDVYSRGARDTSQAELGSSTPNQSQILIAASVAGASVPKTANSAAPVAISSQKVSVEPQPAHGVSTGSPSSTPAAIASETPAPPAAPAVETWPNPAASPAFQVAKLPTVTDSIGQTLKLIPAGEFDMGSPDIETGASSDEHPMHHIRITKPFYLSACCVTVSQFTKFVAATKFKTDAEHDGYGCFGFAKDGSWNQSTEFNWRNTGWPQTAEHPVVNVSWDDAVQFCKWLTGKEGRQYRLPTEAEWEYACRAGTTTRFFFGDEADDLAKYANVADANLRERLRVRVSIKAADGFAFTAPVGRYRPNPFGLYDMLGNSWQWCADWYHPGYYKSNPPADDPRGPPDGLMHVARGGCWYSSPDNCRCATRDNYFRSNGLSKYYSLGFRVARDQ